MDQVEHVTGRVPEILGVEPDHFESAVDSVAGQAQLLGNPLRTLDPPVGTVAERGEQVVELHQSAQQVVCVGDQDPVADLERVLRLSTGENESQANERAEAHFRLGEAWASLDEPAKAARHFRASQGEDASDRRGAGIRLAELEAQPSPTKASAAYVRALFDGYAPRYDGHMQETLSYRGPELLRAAAEKAGVFDSAPHDAIDLGCGTGLSGAAFRGACGTMLGVDLSPRMCAAAEASGFYTRVVAGELVATVEAEAGPFSLAIACDTVIYLGDLAPLFTALAAKMPHGGWFVFSTEKSDGTSEEAAARGFEIGPTRRFRHTETYLRDVAVRLGFEVASLDRDVLRTEKRVPVESFVCVMKRV